MSGNKMSRIGIGFCVGAMLTVLCGKPAFAQTACNNVANARSVVFIARYSGAQTGEPTNQLSNFILFLSDRVEVWRESLASVIPKAPFIGHLTVSASEDKDLTRIGVLTADQAYQAWKAFKDRLQILYGTVGQVNGRYVITSRVHLGDLEDKSGPSSVVISLPMDEATIGATNDAHSLVTYYSLALEARRIACPAAVIIDLLVRARESAIDIQRRIPNDHEVKRVASEVELLMKQLRAGGERPP
jgi:hypothetical protein